MSATKPSSGCSVSWWKEYRSTCILLIWPPQWMWSCWISLQPTCVSIETQLCLIWQWRCGTSTFWSHSSSSLGLVALGMMAAQRCGMPCQAIRSHAKSLEIMNHTAKTVHSISETSHSGAPFAPLLRTGRGSGASPSVFSPMMEP